MSELTNNLIFVPSKLFFASSSVFELNVYSFASVKSNFRSKLLIELAVTPIKPAQINRPVTETNGKYDSKREVLRYPSI